MKTKARKTQTLCACFRTHERATRRTKKNQRRINVLPSNAQPVDEFFLRRYEHFALDDNLQ